MVTHKGGTDWILIKLDERREVSFDERSRAIAEMLQSEKIDPKAIRDSLRSLWNTLEVELFIDHVKVDLHVADSEGFMRVRED